MSSDTTTEPSSTFKLLNLTTTFVLSAGTITLDPIHRKLLILKHTPSSEYLLPKGRKNIGEALEDAAVRETFEESGFECKLLRHELETLATQGEGTEAERRGHTEPIAVQQRVSSDGVRKIIFWFVAEGDSRAEKVEGTTVQEGEEFESCWVDFVENGTEMLSWSDDREVVKLAMRALDGTEK